MIKALESVWNVCRVLDRAVESSAAYIKSFVAEDQAQSDAVDERRKQFEGLWTVLVELGVAQSLGWPLSAIFR